MDRLPFAHLTIKVFDGHHAGRAQKIISCFGTAPIGRNSTLHFAAQRHAIRHTLIATQSHALRYSIPKGGLAQTR